MASKASLRVAETLPERPRNNPNNSGVTPNAHPTSAPSHGSIRVISLHDEMRTIRNHIMTQRNEVVHTRHNIPTEGNE